MNKKNVHRAKTIGSMRKKPKKKIVKKKVGDSATSKQLADAAGVKESRLLYLTRQKVVVRDVKTGKFSIKKDVPILKKYLKNKEQTGNHGRPSNEQKALIDKLITDAEKEVGTNGIDILEVLLRNPRLSAFEAKRIGDILKAQDILQDLKVKSGELVSIEDYSRESFKAGRYLRNAMLAIPERLSDQIAAIDDPDRVQKLLTKEIVKSLSSIPKGKEYGFLKT